MHYDPFQTTATLGAYSGFGNPFHSPHTALQTSALQPSTAWGIPQQVGAGQFGINPQSLYNTNPYNPWGLYGGGVSSQLFQNPFVQNTQQNPLALAGLQTGISQNPLLQNPVAQQILAQQLAQQAIAQQIAQQVAQQQVAQQLAILAQQNSLYGQQGSLGTMPGQTMPFQTAGSPFGQMAPQSWVGQGVQGIPGVGGINPLTARGLQYPGVGFPY
jgi:hypothetical protein